MTSDDEEKYTNTQSGMHAEWMKKTAKEELTQEKRVKCGK